MNTNMCAVKTICITFFTEIIIGLYNEPGEVLESVGEVEVCVIVFMPQLPCPIMYPFAINIFTTDDTASEGSNVLFWKWSTLDLC